MTPVSVLLLAALLSLLLPAASASTLAVSGGSVVCGVAVQNGKVFCAAAISASNSSSPVAPFLTFSQVSGGAGFLCGLRAGGTAFFCWPPAAPGQLRRVYNGPDALADLAVGSNHVAAYEYSARRILWSRGGTRFPAQVEGDFLSLVSGDDFSCAVETNSSAVRCWGPRGSAVQAAFSNAPVSSLAAGGTRACGVQTSGAVLCCGSGAGGLAPRDLYVHGLAVGDSHACGLLRPNHTAVCWSLAGPTTTVYYPAFGTAFEFLVAGGSLTCGLVTINFSVMCWSSSSTDNVAAEVSLPTILPGVCVPDLSSCECGVFPRSEQLCAESGGGVICKRLCELPPAPMSLPPSSPPPAAPSRGGTSEVRSWGSKRVKRRGMIVGVVTGASVAALGLFPLVLLLILRRNRRKRFGHILKKLHYGGCLLVFRYSDLQHATKNFSEKLGRGGFGSVFKGFLNDSNTIAVKRLDGARQGEKQFRAEVSSIGIIQHINLVKLIGFCCEGDRRLLVYEHMPNGSLDSHLFQRSGIALNWTIRYQIALGVARGLAYLHDSCRDCIIHCDIKPQNILLDASFIPKVADFGMAKILGREFSRVVTTMRGTIGYLAPEWISGTDITQKADVYSYGMVLFEIISGRRNSGQEYSSDGDHAVYFPLQVARELLNGDVGSLFDANLHGDASLEEVERVCKVACWCIQDNEFGRPTMTQVVQFLEGLLELDAPPVPRLLHAIAEGSHSTSL